MASCLERHSVRNLICLKPNSRVDEAIFQISHYTKNIGINHYADTIKYWLIIILVHQMIKLEYNFAILKQIICIKQNLCNKNKPETADWIK